MRVMIIGCGRVGSVLANQFDEVGHQVACSRQESAGVSETLGKIFW